MSTASLKSAKKALEKRGIPSALLQVFLSFLEPKLCVSSFDVYYRADDQVVRRRVGWETTQHEIKAVESVSGLDRTMSTLVVQFSHRVPEPGVSYKLGFLQRLGLASRKDMWKFKKQLSMSGCLKFLHMEEDDVIIGDATGVFGVPFGIVVNLYNVFLRGNNYVLMTRCVVIQIPDRWWNSVRVLSRTGWRHIRTFPTTDMRCLDFHREQLDQRFTHFPW